ncbi:MAG: hypothetical protein JWP18_1785, partial [Solirubrobacterales bacterium]|nr:hypothetical protein [Solirubrobacterales bacterium]
SNMFSYFVAAAPGARELVTATKIWELAQRPRWKKGDETYDVVVADLPATGHALGLLRAPRTFNDIARIGPIASQAGTVARAIADVGQTAVVAVTIAGELPVSETLDLQRRVEHTLDRGLDLIVANDVLVSRWTEAEAVDVGTAGAVAIAGRVHGAISREAARAAGQREQLARLETGAVVPVVELPHLTALSLGPDDVRVLADALISALT